LFRIGQIFGEICEDESGQKLQFGQKKWAIGHLFLKSGQRKSVAALGEFGFVAKNPLFSVN
jgi:hypothetical protein